MGFVEAVRVCLRKKYATFSGRAPRSEYWWFGLFCFLLSIVLWFIIMGIMIMTMSSAVSEDEINNRIMITYIPFAIVQLGILLPTLAVTIRRIHDLNYSGWWFLGFIVLSFVPILNFIVAIVFLVFLCLKGTEGPNRFGPDPLNPVADADVFN